MTDNKHIVIIPRQHIIKAGTLKHILNAAEISSNDSENLYKDFSLFPGCLLNRPAAPRNGVATIEKAG